MDQTTTCNCELYFTHGAAVDFHLLYTIFNEIINKWIPGNDRQILKEDSLKVCFQAIVDPNSPGERNRIVTSVLESL